MLHAASDICCLSTHMSWDGLAALFIACEGSRLKAYFNALNTLGASEALSEQARRALAMAGASSLDEPSIGLPWGVDSALFSSPMFSRFKPKPSFGVFEAISTANRAAVFAREALPPEMIIMAFEVPDTGSIKSLFSLAEPIERARSRALASAQAFELAEFCSGAKLARERDGKGRL